MQIIAKTHSIIVKDPPKEILEKLKYSYIYKGDKYNKYMWEYDKEKDIYYLPRYSLELAEYVDPIEWKRVSIPFYYTLRDYQERIVNRWLEKGRGIISANTGTGKTVMACYIAHKLGLKTLVVVPSRTLLEQWLVEIQHITGIVPSVLASPIYEYDKPITVAMLHTLALAKEMKKLRPLLEKEFGLVIYDEVHRLGAEEFSKVAYYFHDKHRLGLSATPDRRDNRHLLFIAHIGGVVVDYKHLVVTPTVYRLNYMTKYNNYEWRDWKGNLNNSKMLEDITSRVPRNLMIAMYVKQLYDKGRNIMVLSDRLAQLEFIAKQLDKYGVEYGFLTGQVKDKDKRVVLATYGAGGEGFDRKDLDALILATPRKDVRQAVGRVLRSKDKSPIILDVVDNDEILLSLWKSRERYYKQIKAEIKGVLLFETDIMKKIQGGSKQ